MTKRRSRFIFISVLVFTIVLFLFAYKEGFRNNVSNDKPNYDLYIENESTYQAVFDQLVNQQILIDTVSFKLISKLLGYADHNIKSGHYLLKPGTNNYKLIAKLRSGNQDPIKVTINNVRDIDRLCGKLDGYLMLDSVTLLERFKDTNFLQTIGYTPENILSLFIPNTYEMYWNISLDKFIQRLQSEHDKFWNKDDRKSKALALGLDTKGVYSLASIVEKETIVESERPSIAGVYLNRLKTGMKLQADPTVVFALGLAGIQRVLLEHLQYPSPYNTYLNDGLPPGPIYMPSVNSIDAVLNAEKHDFIFFCAKPGYQGTHCFAATLSQHYENARHYQKWLNTERIR